MMRTPTSTPWSAAEKKLLSGLKRPVQIQTFLDGTSYSSEPVYRSPRSVMRDNRAHCFDGAMFAAAALERLESRTAKRKHVSRRAHADS